VKTIPDTARRILFTTQPNTFFFALVTVLVALVIAFNAQSVVFYEFDMNASAYQIVIENSDRELGRYAPLEFSFRGNTIVLAMCSTADEDTNIEIFASSRFGASRLTEANMANLSPYYLGNFIAVFPRRIFDLTGDGNDNHVFMSVKTDLRIAQTNASRTPMLNDPRVLFEVGMYEARRLFVYFNGRPLVNRVVYVHFPDGRMVGRVTDEFGFIPNLPVNAVRGGLVIEYSPNIRNTYIQKYMPQNARMISPAITPLVILLGLTAISIFLCIAVRKIHEKRALVRNGGRRFGTAFRTRPKFVLIRWGVMIFSFVALIWGGSWLGVWFEEITIPVFACGRNNEEQLVGSVCYYMSHLNVLFTLPWQTIAMFFAGFFIPLILFGRLLCGFVCPMGLVQDTLHVARQGTRTKGIPLTEKLYARLSIIKWTFVMLFLGMAFVGLDFCMICPVGAFSPALAGFKFSLHIGGFVALFVLVGSFFKHRFFCVICPLGLVMGLFHKISLVRLKKDSTACTECGGCYEACPMGIKQIYTEREKTDVTTINCIMCGECIRHCPETNGLSMTICGRKIYTAKRENFMQLYGRKSTAARGCGGCKQE